MSPFSRFVIAVAMASLPFLAEAEGKCNDDPFLLKDKKTLAVAWTIPMPDQAADPTIEDAQNNPMKTLDKSFPVSPPGFPASYSVSVLVSYVDLPQYPDPPPGKKPVKPEKKVQRLKDKAGHDGWLDNFPLGRDPDSAPITEEYLKGKKHVFGVVVEHPAVIDNGLNFKLCSCILQRAVLLWDDENEDEHLWVRSRFRSAKEDQITSANFEPSAPIKFVFKTSDIWFPLRYNHVLPESPAFLVLDVLTRKQLGEVLEFHSKELGQVLYALPGKKEESWYVTRLQRRFDKGGNPADLSIRPPR